MKIKFKEFLVIALSACFISALSILSYAVTLTGNTDNRFEIGPGAAVTVTSNISSAPWIIDTVSSLYINKWGSAATTSSRKLLAAGHYEIRMGASQFSILGTVTENIIITLKKSTDGRDFLGK